MEELRKDEVIVVLPEEKVAQIKDILAEKQSIGNLIDYAIMKHKQTLLKENEFWAEMRKEYYLTLDDIVYVDFNTRELRKGIRKIG